MNAALLQTGVLGEGTFGVVLRARDPQSVGGGEIAIKLLPRGDFVSGQTLSCMLATTLRKSLPLLRCAFGFSMADTMDDGLVLSFAGQKLQDLCEAGDCAPEQPEAPLHRVVEGGDLLVLCTFRTLHEVLCHMSTL